MKKLNSQAGFSIFELLLIVVVLGIVAVISFRVLNAHSNAPAPTNAASSSKKASDVSSAPAIKKASDLSKAEATLDQNNPATANNGDTNQLDGQLSTN